MKTTKPTRSQALNIKVLCIQIGRLRNWTPDVALERGKKLQKTLGFKNVRRSLEFLLRVVRIENGPCVCQD